MPCAYYKRRAKNRSNQKDPCFVVLLPLKHNSLYSAAPTQNASSCRTMQFQPGGLFTLGRSGRRWVARGNATGLDQKMVARRPQLSVKQTVENDAVFQIRQTLDFYLPHSKNFWNSYSGNASGLLLGLSHSPPLDSPRAYPRAKMIILTKQMKRCLAQMWSWSQKVLYLAVLFVLLGFLFRDQGTTGLLFAAAPVVIIFVYIAYKHLKIG